MVLNTDHRDALVHNGHVASANMVKDTDMRQFRCQSVTLTIHEDDMCPKKYTVIHECDVIVRI